MSGGSFNYLCRKEIWDIAYGVGEEWDQMLSELDMLAPDIATEMRKIKTDTDAFVKEHESRWDRLRNVLRAIEWWRSNDWGKNQVDEAIQKWRLTSGS